MINPDKFPTAPQVEIKKRKYGPLGIMVPEAENRGNSADPENYKDDFKSPTIENMEQDLAMGFRENEPLIFEGGTGIGKTRTVERVCAELGYELYKLPCSSSTTEREMFGRYVSNPERESSLDPEVVFSLGVIAEALVDEPGKIKVIYLDELNTIDPQVGARLHEILDAIKNNFRVGRVKLVEDAGQVLEFDPNRVKIVATVNPADSENIHAQRISSALYRRFTPKKMPDALPDAEFFSFSMDMFQKDDVIGNLPGIADEGELVKTYAECHKGIQALAKHNEIGADLAQKTSYEDIDYLKRVIKKVRLFWEDGLFDRDLTKIFQESVRMIYGGMIIDETEKAKIDEQINHIVYVPKKVKSKRKGLDKRAETQERQNLIDEIKEGGEPLRDVKLEGSIEEQISRAREIMGDREVLGPSEVKSAFGIEVDVSEVPSIPFSEAELERAKELGQFLVLRVNQASDGQPLTMQKISQSYKGKGEALYDFPYYRHAEQPFYTGGEGKKKVDYSIPRAGWALTSKEVISYSDSREEIVESTDKDYLDQSFMIADYLKTKVFAGAEMPNEYKEAIQELIDKKAELTKLIETKDRSKYEPEISKLKLNKLTRQSPAEVLYDILIYFQNNDERLLEHRCTWTHTADSDGRRVRVGHFDSDGASVYGYSDDDSYSVIGVVFSRNF